MVSNPVALKQCLEFLNKEKKQVDYQLRKIQDSCPSYINCEDHTQSTVIC